MADDKNPKIPDKLIDKSVDDKLKDLQKSILYNKLLLNFMIDNKSSKEKLYKWITFLASAITTVVSAIARFYNGNSSDFEHTTSTTVLILSLIASVMMKLEDFIKFDKSIEQAKSQIVKYNDLFSSIEHELLKPIDKRTTDFLHVSTSQYNLIYNYDPEIDFEIRRGFEEYCLKSGIKYRNDLYQLQELQNSDEKTQTKIEISIQKEEKKPQNNSINISEDAEWTKKRLGILLEDK